MSDDDLIRRGDVLRTIETFSHDKQMMRDTIRALPATDAREAALREAAAVADAFADKSIGDADLWRKDGMPKTAVIAQEHAQAARTVAAAILALLGEART